MMRDHLRDYSTEAFRFYARVGKISGAEYLKKLRDGFEDDEDLVRREINANHAAACSRGAAADLDAVKKTLEVLEISGKGEVVEAVKAVYFVMPGRNAGGRDFAARVKNFSLLFPASERSVYRWLRLARKIFAKERGLRL